jgi:hypothetical protein
MTTPTPGGCHAPSTLPVRPLRRRVGPARTAAQQGRKARPTARVVHPSGRRRRVLPAQERLFVADAPARVPTVADRLPPLPQVAHRRPTQAGARPAAGGGARGGGARPGPQRGRDRQPGREDHPRRGSRARLRRRQAPGGAKASCPGRHERARPGRRVHGAHLCPTGTAGGYWSRACGKNRPGWSWRGPTGRTRPGFASGSKESEGGGSRYRTIATGSCGGHPPR